MIYWPPKYNVFGVKISATNYQEATNIIIEAAKTRHSTCVSHLAVHGLILATQEPWLRSMLNEFDIVAPDGQPVRIALNLLYGLKLSDRVAGPDLMPLILERAAFKGVSVYLYGSHPHIIKSLSNNILGKLPKLQIVGSEPSIFRPMEPDEDEALIRRIKDSGAGLVFIGLGCPLQEKFAWEHRGKIESVLICVGAAFDFLAGNVPRAPEWMRGYGVEWLYRVMREPRRLWRRYLTTNSIFLIKLFFEILRLRIFNGRDSKDRGRKLGK